MLFQTNEPAERKDVVTDAVKKRSIAFERISNARDLGGLQTVSGHMISPGCLIRSANLADATQSDKRKLREYWHIAKIIDLRTEIERRERPDVSLPHTDYLTIPIFTESMAGISHEKSLTVEQLFAVAPRMEQLYRQIVTDELCRKNLGKAARCVMEHDFSKGSVLWHCTEGKDRCGLLSAVLLLALGVDRGTITEDYMLTNHVNEAKAERYAQMLRASGKTEAEAARMRDMFLAKEEYLTEAFLAIDEQYKSIDAFLCDGLDIPSELILRFQESVLC